MDWGERAFHITSLLKTKGAAEIQVRITCGLKHLFTNLKLKDRGKWGVHLCMLSKAYAPEKTSMANMY